MRAAVEVVKATLERFKALNAKHLAGAITLAGFLSLFPLILLAVTVLGYIAAGKVDLATNITSELGLGGDSSELVTNVIDSARDKRGTMTVVSLLTVVWSGLRVVDANQYALNTVWGTPIRSGLKTKAVGLGWLAGAGVLFVASIGGAAVAAALLPGPLASLSLVVGLAVDVLLWLWTFTVLVTERKGWRAHLPGAVVGAVGVGVLKAVGSFYLPRSVASASALYGSIGVVFALLAWLLVFGQVVVLATVVNKVVADRRQGLLSEPPEPAPPESPPRPGRSARRGRLRTRTAARPEAG